MKIRTKKVQRNSKPYDDTRLKSNTMVGERRSSFEVEWYIKSHIETRRRILVENTKIIKKYMEKLKVPGWYRGLSNNQKEAARNLVISIRDDSEQHTTHRVRREIVSMGLEPVPGSRKLQILLRMCCGNEIAFLWFLMEMSYRRKGEKGYNINEQIILTCVADLDMHSTLTALDKVLPPPQPNKYQIEQQNRLHANKSHVFQETSQPQTVHKKAEYVLPYFEKLKRPKKINLSLNFSEFSCALLRLNTKDLFQNVYKNRNTNGSVRWFKDYKFSPGERLVRHIIQEETDKIIYHFMCANIMPPELKILCRHHKEIELLETSAEAQLKALEKQRAGEISKMYKRKEQSYKRVMKDLKNDIEKYRREIRQQLYQYRLKSTTKIFLSGFENSCEIYKHIRPEHVPSLTDKFITVIPCGRLNSKGKPHRPKKNCGCVVTKIQKSSQFYENKNVSDDDIGTSGFVSHCSCSRNASNLTQNLVNGLEQSFSLGERPSLISFTEKYLNCELTESAPKYFRAPTGHAPYKFDYRSIFNFKDENDQNVRIMQAFVEAVDSDISLLNQLDRDRFPNVINEAIKNSSTKIFRDEVERYQDEEAKREHSDIKRVNYGLKHYDPDDDKLMERMLIDGLGILKEDPQYVLPTLTSAHRLPILREWIRFRFGKTYTYNDIKNISLKEDAMFRAISRIALSVRMPTPSECRQLNDLNYNNRNLILEKSKKIRSDFYERMDKCALAVARVFYLVMFPSLFTTIPSVNTFFAYMPTYPYNMKYFRPYRKPDTIVCRRRCKITSNPSLIPN